jgi:hypothetical protein
VAARRYPPPVAGVFCSTPDFADRLVSGWRAGVTGIVLAGDAKPCHGREEASTMVLESTCRQLVETQKFVPAICEMLEALRNQKKKWAKRLEIDEAIRSGRLKQIGEKAIAALERREWGNPLPRYWELPESGTPERDEYDKIGREFFRARDWARDACEFKGLDDDGPAVPDYVTPQLSAPKHDDDGKDEEEGS